MITLDAVNELERKYRVWKEQNPAIYALYVRFALEAASVRRRFSISLLTERIRWEYHMRYREDSEGFKVNNNFRAYLSRDVMREHPELDGLLETRRVRGEEEEEVVCDEDGQAQLW